jgi:hypothetical protein
MICTRLASWVTFALALAAANACAQVARDPTLAPPEVGSAADLASPAGAEGMTVLMRADKVYLVVGTRLYAPGDTVGAFRVDRITETEVWLRDATKLVKVPRFIGIERKSLAHKPQCATVESQQNVPAADLPCEDAQP